MNMNAIQEEPLHSRKRNLLRKSSLSKERSRSPKYNNSVRRPLKIGLLILDLLQRNRQSASVNMEEGTGRIREKGKQKLLSMITPALTSPIQSPEAT
jgi:hypothetical protein